jgi:hypothetical protein
MQLYSHSSDTGVSAFRSESLSATRNSMCDSQINVRPPDNTNDLSSDFLEWISDPRASPGRDLRFVPHFAWEESHVRRHASMWRIPAEYAFAHLNGFPLGRLLKCNSTVSSRRFPHRLQGTAVPMGRTMLDMIITFPPPHHRFPLESPAILRKRIPPPRT